MDNMCGFAARQSLVQAIVVVDQIFVVDPQTIQNCGVEIMYADSIMDGVISEVIGATVCRAAAHTATGAR